MRKLSITSSIARICCIRFFVSLFAESTMACALMRNPHTTDPTVRPELKVDSGLLGNTEAVQSSEKTNVPASTT
jgi:hypothetical protein